jgi:hypothetical protein
MDSLVYRQANEVLARTAGRTVLACEGSLRVGAATLCNSAAGDVTATIVVCYVDSVGVEHLEELVAQIADEFGLEATIRQRHGSSSVRFTCPIPAVVEEMPKLGIKALLARLLAR